MINKKERTMDKYLSAGAHLRALKSLWSKTVMEVSPLLSSADTDKFLRLIDDIEVICSHAEDKMFADYPKLSNEYIDVFYGDVKSEGRNSVDKEQIERASQVVKELFE